MKYSQHIASATVCICLWLTATSHILLVTALAGRALGTYLLGNSYMLIALPLHLFGFAFLITLLAGLLMREALAGRICLGLFTISILSTIVLTIRNHIIHDIGLAEPNMYFWIPVHLLSWIAIAVLLYMIKNKMLTRRILKKTPTVRSFHSREAGSEGALGALGVRWGQGLRVRWGQGLTPNILIDSAGA